QITSFSTGRTSVSGKSRSRRNGQKGRKRRSYQTSHPMNKLYPAIEPAGQLNSDQKRLFIGACGFEQRSLGWPRYQKHTPLTGAIVFEYRHPKGKNKIAELYGELHRLGAKRPRKLMCDVRCPYAIEDLLDAEFQHLAYD